MWSGCPGAFERIQEIALFIKVLVSVVVLLPAGRFSEKRISLVKVPVSGIVPSVGHFSERHSLFVKALVFHIYLASGGSMF